MEVNIDGVRYVPADDKPEEEALKILATVYGMLWMENVDPTSEEIAAFAIPLAKVMGEANKILKFKK